MILPVVAARALKAAVRRLDRADLRLLSLLSAPLKRQMVRRLDAFLGRAVGAEHTVDGFRLVVPTEQVGTYVVDEHEPTVVEAIRASLRPDAVAVDVGANIGWLTLQMARAVGSGGRVLAFEPNSQNLSYLRRNVAGNGLGQVHIYDCALGSANEVRSFRLDLGGTRNRLLMPEEVASAETDVAVRTLDSLISGPVDLIKIDTEGNELDVLRGADQVISASPVVQVIIEWSAASMRDCAVAPSSLAAWFHERDFELFELTRSGVDYANPFRDWECLKLPEDGYVNVLACRSYQALARE